MASIQPENKRLLDQELEEGELLESEEEDLEASEAESELLLESSWASELSDHPIRYFSNSILQMNPMTWNTLRRDEREHVLFDFWIKTSWGKGFPCTMNLMRQRNPTGSGAFNAFMSLFSWGEKARNRVNWRIIEEEHDAISVECMWYDQWDNEHFVEGAGETLDLARTDAAQKALQLVFFAEDLRVLHHVHSPFIYGGSPGQRVNINRVWGRLKEAKNRQNGHGEYAAHCYRDDQHLVQATDQSESVDNVASSDPEAATEFLRSSHESSADYFSPFSPSPELSEEPNTSRVSSPWPDPQTSSALTCTENTDSGSRNDEAVRYFDEDILKVTPEIWETLTKDEKEQILYDFWIQTSYDKGFPWTMNLVQQKNPLGGGAFHAFMLLFSEGRYLKKKGVKWLTVKEEEDDFSVECVWRDQWGNEHRVEGTGKKVYIAQKNAALKALRIIFCPRDLRVLRHVSSPFIYEGPSADRVSLKFLWNRLKQAKLQDRKQQSKSKDFPRRRKQKQTPHCSVRSEVVVVTNSSLSSSTQIQSVDGVPSLVPDTPPQVPDAGPATLQEFFAHPAPESSSSAQNAGSHRFSRNEQSARYFNDSILKVTHGLWNTLSTDEREQILFDFWIQTSWGEGFPWTMNLMLQKPFGGGALPAFMLLFGEGKSLRKEGVIWRTIKKGKDASTVRLIWNDQWNNQHCVEGTGKTVDQSRIIAAQNALKLVFCTEDLQVLFHVHSLFIYDGPESHRVLEFINRLWDRLKEAKQRRLGRDELTEIRPDGRQRKVRRSRRIAAQNALNSMRRDSAGSPVPDTPMQYSSSSSTEQTMPPAVAPAQNEVFSSGSNLPISVPPPAVAEARESLRSRPESPPDDSLDDQFAEYFSTNDDGTLEIPQWITEKYLKPSNDPTDTHSDDFKNSSDAISELDKTEEETDLPYLPFDRIIGYEYPQEAAIALQLLFEGNKHTEQPKFDVTKYFLAELKVGDLVFQALGLTEEEAQEAAAAKALEALSDNQEGKTQLLTR